MATIVQESPFQKFLGVMVSAIALAIAAGVVVYFHFVFWLGRALDFNLVAGGQPIPAETYPFILYTAWTLSQRAMSHWRPKDGALGRAFWWLDLGSSVIVFVYMMATLVQAIASGNNLSFIIVLVAFTMQAFFDTLLNGRHLYAASEAVESFIMPARRMDGAGILVAGNAGRDINIFPAGSKVRLTVDDDGARVTAIEPAVAESAAEPVAA
jgi:hypothetical protein